METSAATPAGELLRRYWHPVARSSDATSLPRKVRILSEDLILFRDGRGRPGLVEPRCCHRGTTLYYGRVEDDGIRCPYHGWLFAVDGACLDQPCEPDRGRNRASYRQPWYPVQEYNGLVFAYLGPADRQPVFPRYDIFEGLRGDEEIVIIDHFAFGGPTVAPCNWFQTHENAMDPYHVFILHNAISGHQFDPRLEIWPRIDWQGHAWGVTASQDRDLPDGNVLHRVTEIRVPTIRVIPTPTLTVVGKTNNMSWSVPIDDTHTWVVSMLRKPKDRRAQGLPTYGGDKTWFDLDDEGHQRYPGDYETQVGQVRSPCTPPSILPPATGGCRWCGASSSTRSGWWLPAATRWASASTPMSRRCRYEPATTSWDRTTRLFPPSTPTSRPNRSCLAAPGSAGRPRPPTGPGGRPSETSARRPPRPAATARRWPPGRPGPRARS